ncbi:MAG: DNA mismatch repair protein MutS [Clostridia bacterium]|nr:DNA mismatch repair protein MutS [Clostridia bacterium]
MAEFTPMMQQYLQTKEQYKNEILFYRLGDFYEMFFDDAVTVSRELDLVLTGKDCGQEERAPMCGVPFHAADSYIARLVAKGYKVAICEQLEDPAQAKGIVKRGVIRIVTPGTVIESSMLDESRNNYLCSACAAEHEVGLAFVDVSTGAVFVTTVSSDFGGAEVLNELGRFSPSEVMANEASASVPGLTEYEKRVENVKIQFCPEEKYDFSAAEELITKHFGKSLDELGLASKTSAAALGAALSYLYEMQKTELSNIRAVNYYTDAKYMRLDFAARRNLELTETMRNRDKRGSLLWVLDRTKTAMGKRMLRSYIEQPLVSPAGIIRRQNAVAWLINNLEVRDEIAGLLTDVHDMERLMTRISYGTANARELRSLYETVSLLAPIKEHLKQATTELLTQIENDIDPLEDILDLIDDAIAEDPPFSVREGGMIRDGYNEELDSLREILNGGKGYLAKIEADEKERTGITKLKIGYNRVFGYYIEVSNSFKDMVPEDYIRKQTLTNCERYITRELKELESKVLGAQERITRLEYELFSGVRDTVAAELDRVQRTANAVSALDVLCAFAKVSNDNNYTCPEISEDGVIEIKDGRHPVVEKMLDGSPFVPNDTYLDNGDNLAAIITGPNMAGKSTYMRQVALMVIMAQMGCFVPASYAHISICDSVFTRVGASDDLASGQSTFMVEMTEVASILKNATKNSLVILDEIGRGTSTFDGMSIARAVLEYVCSKKIGAKTLFATHYHELTELEGDIPGIKNYNIACKKRGDDIIFLRRIVPGPADGSYGIEVAKLAGVPNTVVKRAHEVLEEIVAMQPGTQAGNIAKSFSDVDDYYGGAGEPQLSFAANAGNAIIDELKEIDVNTLTPIEAMQYLYDLVKKAKEN